jgi:hypothetical protein
MSWTEDIAQAAWFASRRSNQFGTATILSTSTMASRTLARFEHEMEVVLPYDPDRTYEVVAMGEEECVSYCNETVGRPSDPTRPLSEPQVMEDP